MKYLYFYAGIIPGTPEHEYVSGTLTLDQKVDCDGVYRDVLHQLEDAYGEQYSMLNFNYMGATK